MTWSAIETAYSYEIFLEIEGKYEKLTETPLLTFKLKTMTNGGTYNFKVRAKDACGISKFSSLQVLLDTSSPPGEVTDVSVETLDCAILVSWTGPANLGGLAVTEYKFQLRTNNSEYTSAVLNCTLSNTTCYLPMTTMQSAPYYLKVGQEISVRITTAN